MNLRELLERAGIEAAADSYPEVTSLIQDSRKSIPGSVFFCVPGSARPAEEFISQAVSRGAVFAFVTSERGLELASEAGIPAERWPSDRREFNRLSCALASAFYDQPTRRMRAVAVTGTNGKTTTAWLVRILLEAIEGPSAYLGTLGYLSPKGFEGLENTTPFPIDLYQLVGDAATQGCRGLAMEVSSHALDEHRADFLEFDCAIFTNLTEDHLDYHKTMEAYAEAKLRLFQDFPGYTKKPMVAVINVGDPYGAEYTKKIETPVFRYGTSDGVDLKAELLHLGVSSMRVRFTSRNEGSAESDVQLGGDFNFWNVTSAVAAMVAMGHPLTVVGGHLDKLKPVPGRFEPVINNTGVGVLIDYAHTPDALEKLLGTARKLTTKRLISLFGCGGDRQTTKRAPMGRISSQLADVTFITSDNPRTEDPRLIAEEVQSGALPGRDVRLVIDRKEAILQAIGCAEPGDVVVLAGKGHEEYQIIGREKFHMSDREMAIEALRQRGED